MNPLKRPGSLKHLMWLSLLSMLLIIAPPIPAAPTDVVERISRNDLRPAKDGMPGEEELTKEIVVAPNIRLMAKIEVTAKGNGLLHIANLNLKVFDSHNDGVFYENEMLNIDFVDLNGDGKREMVISGIVCFTDEKGDKVMRREAVVYIYALQSDRTFKQVYRNTDFRID